MGTLLNLLMADGWMDQQKGGWTDGWIRGKMNGWVHGWWMGGWNDVYPLVHYAFYILLENIQ